MLMLMLLVCRPCFDRKGVREVKGGTFRRLKWLAMRFFHAMPVCLMSEHPVEGTEPSCIEEIQLMVIRFAWTR